MDRLFVPLKTEFYRAFESGEKIWELRGINDQFNKDTVYEGRKVELRRGYSTDDSLWGEISDFKVYPDIPSIVDSIDHRDIDPGKDEEGFIEGAKKMMGKYDKYILFKVNLDS